MRANEQNGLVGTPVQAERSLEITRNSAAKILKVVDKDAADEAHIRMKSESQTTMIPMITGIYLCWCP